MEHHLNNNTTRWNVTLLAVTWHDKKTDVNKVTGNCLCCSLMGPNLSIWLNVSWTLLLFLLGVVCGFKKFRTQQLLIHTETPTIPLFKFNLLLMWKLIIKSFVYWMDICSDCEMRSTWSVCLLVPADDKQFNVSVFIKQLLLIPLTSDPWPQPH